MSEKDSRKWYEKTGESGDTVCSTRVRLARNLARVPFPDRAGPEDKGRVIEQVRAAIRTALSPGSLASASSVSSQRRRLCPWRSAT